MSDRWGIHTGRGIPGEWSGIELDDTPTEPAPSPLKTIPVHALEGRDSAYTVQPGDPLVAEHPEDVDANVAARFAIADQQRRPG